MIPSLISGSRGPDEGPSAAATPALEGVVGSVSCRLGFSAARMRRSWNMNGQGFFNGYLLGFIGILIGIWSMGLDINVVKTIIYHPFGNGNHTTYTNGDFGDGLLLF